MRFLAMTHSGLAVALGLALCAIGGCKSGPISEIQFEGPDGADHDRALSTMKNRIEEYGDVVDGTVVGRSVIVRARIREGAEIAKLGQPGVLSFHKVEDEKMQTLALKPTLQRVDLGYEAKTRCFKICGTLTDLPPPTNGGQWAQMLHDPKSPDANNGCAVLLAPASLSNVDVENAEASTDSLFPSVNVVFTDKGREKFTTMTDTLKGQRLAIVLDGEIHSAPIVREKIAGGRASIAVGSGSTANQLAEAKQLAAVLRSARLPGAYVLVRMEQLSSP